MYNDIVKTTNTNSYSFVGFTNSTIAYNQAPKVGGIYHYLVNPIGGATNCYISNSILWENESENITSNLNYYLYLNNSLLGNKYCPENVSCSEGNMYGVNPLFVDTLNNFSLTYESPAIDRGDYNLRITGDSLDIDLNSRIIATLNLDTAIIDLGAYEFQNAPILSIAYDTQLTHISTEYLFADTFYENESCIYSFNLKNVGNQLLSFVEDPTVQIESDTNFHILQQIIKKELGLSETDTFKIQFNAVEAGDFVANIQIPYNSFDGKPYEFKLLMNVMPRPDTPRLKISLLAYPEIDLRDTILKDTLCYKFDKDYFFQIENIGNGTLLYKGNEKVNLGGNGYSRFMN